MSACCGRSIVREPPAGVLADAETKVLWYLECRRRGRIPLLYSGTARYMPMLGWTGARFSGEEVGVLDWGPLTDSREQPQLQAGGAASA